MFIMICKSKYVNVSDIVDRQWGACQNQDQYAHVMASCLLYGAKIWDYKSSIFQKTTGI